MALVDKLGLSIFALWWGFAIWFTDGACPAGDKCADANYEIPGLIWIGLRLAQWARHTRLVRRIRLHWSTQRQCARFADES